MSLVPLCGLNGDKFGTLLIANPNPGSKNQFAENLLTLSGNFDLSQ